MPDDEKRILEMDYHEHGVVLNALNDYRNDKLAEGRATDIIDEVRMLDNRYALLFVRGERPIVDEQFNLLRHPNIALTPDGGGKPYCHDGLDALPNGVPFDASRPENYLLLDGDELAGLITGQTDDFEVPEEEIKE